MDELRPVLVANDFATLFSIILEDFDVSQLALGNCVDLSQDYVSKVARRAKTIQSVRVHAKIIHGLEMPDTAVSWLLTGAYDLPLVVATAGGEPDVNRRDLMLNTIVTVLTSGIAVSGAVGEKLTAAAKRPDPTTADHLAGLVVHLSDECLVRPIAELVPLSASLVDLAECWLRTAPDRLRLAIGRSATDAMALHWWFLINTGRQAEAAVMQAKVMESAATWDIPALAGHLLTRRSGLAMGAGDPIGAIRLAAAARAEHSELSPAGTLLAAIFEARACAIAGDSEGLRRAVDTGQVAHARVDPASERPWLRWINGPQLVMAESALRLFDQGTDAAAAYSVALAAYPAERTRDRAYFTATLAVARALGGDVEGAARDTESALLLTGKSGTTVPVVETGLPTVARGPHLGQLRTVLADHGLAVA